MVDTGKALPDFEEPPVVETALGVEFTPIQGWSVPHFGLYWSEIRSEFPSSEVQPLLGSQIEKFGSPERPGQPVLIEFEHPARLRCWFIDATKSKLVQVQDTRFIVNWRKVDDTQPYPRYPTCKDQFARQWTAFRDFLGRAGLSTPPVVQCEVTYVNHLLIDREWKHFGDLSKVLAPWSGRTTDGFLPDPEAGALSVRYIMPGKMGRLHVVLQRGIRHTDGRDILQLTLTARGAPASEQPADVSKWLDLGREWVVRGFADLTSTEMHALWRRKA